MLGRVLIAFPLHPLDALALFHLSRANSYRHARPY